MGEITLPHEQAQINRRQPRTQEESENLLWRLGEVEICEEKRKKQKSKKAWLTDCHTISL